MSGVQHLQVQPDQAGMRLDRWFRSLFPHISHIQLEKLLRKGQGWAAYGGSVATAS